MSIRIEWHVVAETPPDIFKDIVVMRLGRERGTVCFIRMTGIGAEKWVLPDDLWCPFESIEDAMYLAAQKARTVERP